MPPKKAYDSVSHLEGGDQERVLLEQLPQVRYIARRIHDRLPSHIPLDDLVQAGILGLIEALHKFDASKNVELKTYAKHRIQGAILDSLRDLTGAHAPYGRRRASSRGTPAAASPVWPSGHGARIGNRTGDGIRGIAASSGRPARA